MPDERDGASIAFVEVDLPPALRRVSGDPTYNGCCADPVKVVLRVNPRTAGDFTIPVKQGYSDGQRVGWSVVVHVSAAENANRDRIVILLLTAAIAVAVFALRRGRDRR